MALDRDSRSIESGPRPDVCHRRIQFSAHAGFGCVDTELWQQFLFRRQIKSREEDCPPAARPYTNFARQRKRAPQKRNRSGYVPARDRGANGGARNNVSSHLDWRNNFDVKAVALPKLAKQPHIPSATMPKPKIGAN